MKSRALLFLTFLFLTAAPEAQEVEQPRVLGLLMYADWCQSCKVLEPKLNEVKKDFDGKGILFIRFDMTNEFTKNQSVLFASWTGLNEIFDKHVNKTGYMLLIDSKSRNVLAKITKTQTPEEIRSTIRAALR